MKPGQFININGTICRVKKATNYCKGCFYENKISCPCIVDARTVSALDCKLNGFIYVKP